ncbi:hypothetical protein FRB99_005860 [Tulasnella sp. 403]|nr:hypothetical protein FRB99_005860 [Tulasnella sp. 403]
MTFPDAPTEVEAQWIFQPANLQSTPSKMIDNIPTQQELRARNEGIHFLLRVGNALKLKSNVLSTAATYFHRFYMRHSIGPSGYEKTHIAGACIFLASKVEESTRKLRDVAQVCYLKYTSDPDLKYADKWMSRILYHETILLEALCFDLIVPHPHEYLAEVFGGSRDALHWYWTGPLVNKDMIPQGLYQLAWAVANDSLRLPVCLFWSPRLVACAAYLIAFVMTYVANHEPNPATSSLLKPAPAEQPNSQSAGPSDPSGPSTQAPLDTAPPGTSDSDPATPSPPPEETRARVAGGSNDSLQALERPLPVLTLDDLLGGSTVAGPWGSAFNIQKSEFKDLADITGNILELYNVPDPQVLTDTMRRVPPPKSYSSLSGLSHPSSSIPSLATSNSSPALTLASNATPMHRAGEDSSQDFGVTLSEAVEGSRSNVPPPIQGSRSISSDIQPADPDSQESNMNLDD